MRHVKTSILAAVLTLLALGVWADGVIDILPDGVTTTTLASPGSYLLAGDVTTSDPDLSVITISGVDVTLDLGGHVIQGASGGSSMGRGVNITGDRARVHGGSVRAFSSTNVRVSGAGAWLHDLRLGDSPSRGLDVQLGGTDCLVERCSLFDNTLFGINTSDQATRLVVRDSSFASNGTGLSTFADYVQILNCSFTGNTTVGVTIAGAGALNGVVMGNVFTNNGTGVADSGTNTLVANNFASGNTTNYSSVASVTSQAASNEFGDNLTP